MNLKPSHSYFLWILILLTQPALSQSKFNGAWFYTGKREVSRLFCLIENQQLTHYTIDKETDTFVEFSPSQEEGYQFVKHFQENKNNATYYWINTCEGCGWTETQIYHIFHISEHVKYVKFTRMVNNIDVGLDSGVDECWDEEGACFTVTDEGFMRRMPTSVLEVKSYGALSQSNFIPIELRHTQFTSELRVKLSVPDVKNYETYLAEPGESNAFYLRDNQGNKYKIVDQLGFGGFKSKIIDPGEELEFVLIFEKMPEDVKSFSLIEGDCDEGCWHAYDIRV